LIRRPPISTPLYSSAASDVYKRQASNGGTEAINGLRATVGGAVGVEVAQELSLIHISEPTRLRRISYAVFCLKKKKKKKYKIYIINDNTQLRHKKKNKKKKQ